MSRDQRSPSGRSSSSDHVRTSSPEQETFRLHALIPGRATIPSRIGPYELRGAIGEGSFSLVKLAYHTEVNAYFACKVLNRRFLRDQSLLARFESEIRVHQQLHHPSIVKLADLLEDSENYYVFLEFCAGGELFQYILQRGKLSEGEAKPLIKQILEGVRHLHVIGVSHRDLKPENLLLSGLGDMKISDFGLSRFVGSDGLVETPCGSPCYASPECLSGVAYNGRTTDCWSAGVVLFKLVTGQLPLTKRNQRQLFDEIRSGMFTIPPTIGRACQGLIRGLMTVDPAMRLTAERALQHPFFTTNPPPEFATFPGKGFLSLKHIDRIFSEERSELELPVKESSSRPGPSLEKVLREVRVKR
jgi:serine/threonine protein kinase